MGSVAPAWAKSPYREGTAGSGRLDLTDHSVDVAAVAEALLGLPTIRARLSALAERELSDVDVARLCFFVGLHDAGKVNHGFQAKLMGRKPEAGHIGPLWSILRSPSFRREEIELQQDVLGALLVLRWRTWFESKDAALDLWGVILLAMIRFSGRFR